MVNGTVRAVFSYYDSMHETYKFYVTARFALSEKLALKSLNFLIKDDV